MRHPLAVQCPPGSIAHHTPNNYHTDDSICTWCQKPLSLAADPNGEGEPGWDWIITIRIVEWP